MPAERNHDSSPLVGIGRLLPFLVVLIPAVFFRFYALDHSAVRSDEINFLQYAARDQSIGALWAEPPWYNQIPLADTFPILWSRLMPFRSVTEGLIREPFALLGVLTVLVCMVWTRRRYGPAVACLAGMWMAVLPYHIYHSREAYYYALVMFGSAGMTLQAVHLMSQAALRKQVSFGSYAAFAIWAAIAGHSHMSAWIVLGLVWAGCVAAGVFFYRGQDRSRHLLMMAGVTGFLALAMIRWVLRALIEVRRAAEDPSAHIGWAYDWVAPRVLPVFAAGVNVWGIGLLVILALSVGLLVSAWIRRSFQPDPVMRALTLVVAAGLAGCYTYIFIVAAGAQAKLSFFAVVLPPFLVWAACVIGAASARLVPAWKTRAPYVWAGLILLILAQPAWMMTRLDGKPTPYKILQQEMDNRLPAGTVVVVDRWFEPWNELSVYAPTNVHVTFTIPDEPYEAFLQNQWRAVTRHYLESGRGQAYLMLTMNHWEREGVWTWPQEYFARHAAIENTAGLWLRERGYAPIGDFYEPHTNRVVVNLFYDLPEDRVERARAAGETGWVLHDAEWGYLKPWRPLPGWPEQLMQLVWIQAGAFGERGRGFGDLDEINRLPQFEIMQYLNQGRWADYRIPSPHSAFRVFNLTDSEARMELRIVGVGVSGPIRARVGNDMVSFPPTRMVERRIPLTLQPGEQTVRFSVQPDQLLLVLSADLVETP